MVEATSIAPRRSLLLLEGRAIPELFGFAASLPTLSALAPRGDGQPVLVLPGLTTSDQSTVALRKFLKSILPMGGKWATISARGPVSKKA